MSHIVVSMAINEEKYWAAISTVFKMEMKGLDMSQADLAKKVGVGREAMNAYLAGRREMPITVFMRAADAIGLDARTVFEMAEKRMSRG